MSTSLESRPRLLSLFQDLTKLTTPIRLSNNMDDTARSSNSEIASIELYIRVKPLSSTEREDKQVAFKTNQNQASLFVSRSHKDIYVRMAEKTYRKFTFDHVFSESVRNVEIYNRCAQLQVERFLTGFNSSLFAYGQSGTGTLPPN